MSTYGIRIGKEGYDVTKTGNENMYMDTSTPLPKVAVHETGSQNFPTADRSQIYTILILHNLGYVPYYMLFMDRQPGSARRPVYTADTELVSDSPERIFVTCSIDTTQITLTASGGFGLYPPGIGDYGYVCYIFHDPNAEL